MGATVPTLDAVLAAVQSAVSGATGVTNAYAYESNWDLEWEFLRANQNNTTGAVSLAMIACDAVEPREGDATGELYSVYRLRIRYVNVTLNTAAWERTALVVVEAIRTALEGAAAVFAIGGQRQLYTPETVEVRRSGFETIPDHEGSPQYIYAAELGLSVEARRFV